MWCGSVISQERVHVKVPVFAFYLRGSDGFIDGLHETFRFAVRFWPQWCKGPATRNDFVNDIVNDARADAIFATLKAIVDDEKSTISSTISLTMLALTLSLQR